MEQIPTVQETTDQDTKQLNTRMLIKDCWPDDHHIAAMSYAKVGPIYLTLSPTGEILSADAQLLQAPLFKHMIIDDPCILSIFDPHSKKLDMSVLGPFPKFRLDPIDYDPYIDSSDEDDNPKESKTYSITEVPRWEVGRLVNTTHLPRSEALGATIPKNPNKHSVYHALQTSFREHEATLSTSASQKRKPPTPHLGSTPRRSKPRSTRSSRRAKNTSNMENPTSNPVSGSGPGLPPPPPPLPSPSTTSMRSTRTRTRISNASALNQDTPATRASRNRDARKAPRSKSQREEGSEKSKGSGMRLRSGRG